MSHFEMPLRFELLEPQGTIRMVGKAPVLAPGALGQSELFIALDPAQLDGMKTKVIVGVYSGDRLVEKIKSSFVGPMKPPGT